MIVVPFTRLHLDTIKAVPDAVFVRVDGDHGYRLLLQRLWANGEPFTLVEHDVAPTAAQLAALEGCERPWCHYGYCPGDWVPTFGCVRFSADLIAGTQGIWDDASWPWGQLDARFHVAARERGFEPHWHYPHVLHTRFPIFGERQKMTRDLEMYVLQAEIEMVREETLA